ncbi:MAG: large subunit ribosomal protein [Thermoleophilaceae bacterium]|nr:large subunit ribosomal protein [Thermoleophilaceae bacterium]
MAKDDPTTPGADGADEQAKVEQEAAEAKAEEATEAAAQSAEADEPAAEEKPKAKPKPRRSRAKKAPAPAAAAEPEAEADEAKQDEAAAETEAEAAEAAGEPEPEDEQARPAARRRRGGEAAAGQTRRAPRRNAAPDVTVRARAKYVRCAPRKARLVIDHIRGKRVDEARAILTHTPRAASRDVLKLLESAVANAENNHELASDELVIGKAYVDEGPTLKRYRPRALGRATRIRKRTSHLTIELAVKE